MIYCCNFLTWKVYHTGIRLAVSFLKRQLAATTELHWTICFLESSSGCSGGARMPSNLIWTIQMSSWGSQLWYFGHSVCRASSDEMLHILSARKYEVCPKIFLLFAMAHLSAVIFQQNLVQKHCLIPHSQVPKKQASLVYKNSNFEEIRFLQIYLSAKFLFLHSFGLKYVGFPLQQS